MNGEKLFENYFALQKHTVYISTPGGYPAGVQFNLSLYQHVGINNNIIPTKLLATAVASIPVAISKNLYVPLGIPTAVIKTRVHVVSSIQHM